MPQRFETAIAYMAVFQMGAVAMPLSILFGPDALEYRLQDSEAVVAVCDESSIANLLGRARRVPGLAHADRCRRGRFAGRPGATRAEMAAQPRGFTAVQTKADEGAVLIYTSGTTGPPKGAFIPHRALIGNLPGFVCSQNWFGFPTTQTQTQAQARALPPPRGGGLGAGTRGAQPSCRNQKRKAFSGPRRTGPGPAG